MAEFGAYWERKMNTCFKRFDTDGDGVLTKKDYALLAENVIKVGNFTGARADDIRNNYTELWNIYLKPETGDESISTCEDFLKNVKNRGKNFLETIAMKQYTLFFDAVDTDQDDKIDLKEFINYFTAMGSTEEIAKEAFKGLDADHDGVLSREEFVTAGKNFCVLEEPSLPSDSFYGHLE